MNWKLMVMQATMLMQMRMQAIGDGGVHDMRYFLVFLENFWRGEVHWLGFMTFGLEV